jgi:hypothetical protein
MSADPHLARERQISFPAPLNANRASPRAHPPGAQSRGTGTPRPSGLAVTHPDLKTAAGGLVTGAISGLVLPRTDLAKTVGAAACDLQPGEGAAGSAAQRRSGSR